MRLIRLCWSFGYAYAGPRDAFVGRRPRHKGLRRHSEPPGMCHLEISAKDLYTGFLSISKNPKWPQVFGTRNVTKICIQCAVRGITKQDDTVATKSLPGCPLSAICQHPPSASLQAILRRVQLHEAFFRTRSFFRTSDLLLKRSERESFTEKQFKSVRNAASNANLTNQTTAFFSGLASSKAWQNPSQQERFFAA